MYAHGAVKIHKIKREESETSFVVYYYVFIWPSDANAHSLNDSSVHKQLSVGINKFKTEAHTHTLRKTHFTRVEYVNDVCECDRH